MIPTRVVLKFWVSKEQNLSPHYTLLIVPVLGRLAHNNKATTAYPNRLIMVLSLTKTRLMVFVGTCTAALMLSAPNSVVEAHGCGWGSCGRSVIPRHRNYYFNRRRHNMFDLMSDIFSMPIYHNSLHRQSEAQADRMVVERSTPRYELHETDDGVVELTLEVPGVNAKDLIVELEDDGRVLRIQGSRHYRHHGKMVESKFDRMFQMDSDVDMDKVTVTLSSGLLRISAPKKERRIRNIPIEFADAEEEMVVEAKALKESETVDGEREETFKQAQEETQEVVDGLTMTEDDV